MLRSLLTAGRSGLIEQSAANVRMMAAAPKQSLEQYVEGIRNQIADSYNERVEKYDGYVAAFWKLVSTTGLPRASDFAGVKAFAKKRAEMLKQVGFPDDWQVRGPEAEKVRELLKEIPATRKSADPTSAPWYVALTDAQVAECDKDPQLFMELTKMHAFEEQFTLASQAQASKFGLPPVTLDDLPATMEPIGEKTISASEVKWILTSARSQADSLRKTSSDLNDPFNSTIFKKAQEKTAERLGMNEEQLKKAQATMTPEKWKQTCIDAGVAA